MRRTLRFLSLSLIICSAAGAVVAQRSDAQSWLDFAHPTNAHVDMTNPSVPIGVSGLLQSDADVVVSRPTLVVLMEWSDMTHRSHHTPAFWRDLVFANPRQEVRPSTVETFRENSNDRFVLVPATAGDTHDGSADGVVGWVASTQSSGQLTDPSRKRAEGIRVADALFDYNVYDTNNDGLITTDELLIIVVFADNAPTGASCDDHIGHPDPTSCVQRPGGNTRATNPSQVDVDSNTNSPKKVYQHIAGVGEMAHESVVAHEIAHSTLGLGDLYPIAASACGQGYQKTADGYLCSGVWYPPSPEDYSLMAYYWIDYVSHLDPWAKIHLGFTKPLVVTHDGRYTLYDAETVRSFSTQGAQPEAAVIHDPLKTNPYREYFVLENRNDSQLPDRGLAVWLSNEDVPNWPSGLDLRKVVRLFRRGGHWSALNNSLWDGINATDGYDLTASSTPRDTDWTDGTASYIEIRHITQAGGAVSFDVEMTPIFVDKANTGTETGTQTNPFNTVLEGIDAIPEAPRTVRISGGSYPEILTIRTPLTLKGWRNGTVTIGK